MEFSFISICLLVVAAALIMLGASLLFARNWFIQFTRGFVGFGLIFFAVFLIMVGLNLSTYSEVSEGKDIATVSFVKLTEQSFEVTVAPALNGAPQDKYTLDGDLWAIDSRFIGARSKGSAHFYKLNELKGRFYSIEQDRTSGSRTLSLVKPATGVDVWSILRTLRFLPYASEIVLSNYTPMADGAVYAVKTTPSGLKSTPVNEAAVSISKEWK